MAGSLSGTMGTIRGELGKAAVLLTRGGPAALPLGENDVLQLQRIVDFILGVMDDYETGHPTRVRSVEETAKKPGLD